MVRCGDSNGIDDQDAVVVSIGTRMAIALSRLNIA